MQFDSEDPRTRRPRRKLRPLQLGVGDIEAWLLAKDPTAIGAYYDMGPEEYARAFTAAQTAGTDIANDLYFALIDSLSVGGSIADFQSLVMPTLRAKGWLGGDEGQLASRVALIYSTNMMLARRDGRYDGYLKSAALFPYLRAFTVQDDRVRHPPKSPHADHRAWDGIILPVEHAFWREYGTGNFDFRCRCDSVQMTRSQLARYGGAITTEADLAERKQRIGPPRFAGPGRPIAEKLADMVETSNNPDAPRMPGLPEVDPRKTKVEGGDIWDAVIRAKSKADIGRQLARIGL